MTLPIVVFDDIELWATGRLRAMLAARLEPYTNDVYIDIEKPKDPETGEPSARDRMVIIRRDGGPRLDVAREAPLLGVNVYATDEQEVIDLARLVAALIWASPDGDPVCKVTQRLGATPIEDPSGQPRRYMTFELITRGRDA